MRLALASFAALTTIALAGCAAQSPESQLQRKHNVRVCQSTQCVDQAVDTITFSSDPIDAAAQQRLAALTALAETDPRAAHDLALRLLRGDGVQRDSYQGIQWLRRAGDGGLEQAQLALGKMYLDGYEEMGPDPSEALAWLERASAQGSDEARLLIDEARQASRQTREDYQIRAAARKHGGYWYSSAPYFWYWQDRSWYLR